MSQGFFKISVIIGLSLFAFASSYPSARGQESKGGLTPWDPEYYLPVKESDQHPNLPEDYLIGSGDVLEISVWRNEALSRVLVVRPDGKIALPLMGEMQAAGLSPLQLRDKIIAKLKEFGETPEATVIVQQVNSYAIYIVGEVNRPGRFQLYDRTTVVQAIAMAGGFTPFASANKIILRRKAGEADSEKRIKVSYKDIISGKKEDIWLQPGDTIIVP